MNIFTIKHDSSYYDSYEGHVIVATTEEGARELAKKKAASEGKAVWDTAEVEVLGVYTGRRTRPFILMSDFRAG